MQNRFAIVVGIAMLGAAGLVVNQQFANPNTHLQGNLDSTQQVYTPKCGGENSTVCSGTCPKGSVCKESKEHACECQPLPLPTPGPECGDTNPYCNGTCPAGQVCNSNGQRQPAFACVCVTPPPPFPLPTPGPKCGDTQPYCNGTCPAGLVCKGNGLTPPSSECICGKEPLPPPTPGPLCGDSAPYCNGTCPAGQLCGHNNQAECYCAGSGFSSSTSGRTTCAKDFPKPSCADENNPPPFGGCQAGYEIVDSGCNEGTCTCTDGANGPQIRCDHTRACRKIGAPAK